MNMNFHKYYMHTVIQIIIYIAVIRYFLLYSSCVIYLYDPGWCTHWFYLNKFIYKGNPLFWKKNIGDIIPHDVQYNKAASADKEKYFINVYIIVFQNSTNTIIYLKRCDFR